MVILAAHLLCSWTCCVFTVQIAGTKKASGLAVPVAQVTEQRAPILKHFIDCVIQTMVNSLGRLLIKTTGDATLAQITMKLKTEITLHHIIRYEILCITNTQFLVPLNGTKCVILCLSVDCKCSISS